MAELQSYVSVGEFLDRHAGAFFQTRSSLDWFIKRHREELVELGALIPRAGRSGSLVSTEKFPRAVITILRSEAQGRAERAA